MATYDIKCMEEDCGNIYEVKMSMHHTEEDVLACVCPSCGCIGGRKYITANEGGVRTYGIGNYKSSQR